MVVVMAVLRRHPRSQALSLLAVSEQSDCHELLGVGSSNEQLAIAATASVPHPYRGPARRFCPREIHTCRPSHCWGLSALTSCRIRGPLSRDLCVGLGVLSPRVTEWRSLTGSWWRCRRVEVFDEYCERVGFSLFAEPIN